MYTYVRTYAFCQKKRAFGSQRVRIQCLVQLGRGPALLSLLEATGLHYFHTDSEFDFKDLSNKNLTHFDNQLHLGKNTENNLINIRTYVRTYV